MTTEQERILNDFLGECRPLEEAMQLAFDEVREEDNHFKARCCGQEVKYMSGIFGSDFGRCDVCKSEIRMILSPHVSPILLGQNVTHMPTEELIDLVDDRLWWVKKLHDAKKQS